MQQMEAHIVDWLARYGYGAGALAVLSDATGIPWAWVFVMLLAQQAGKSVIGMLLVGFFTLFAWDVALYFVGWKWGTRLLDWLQTRKPKWEQTLETARTQVGKRGALAVIVGRYLPFIGRWVGMGAGMAGVPPLPFALYSLLGCAISAFGFGIPAHFLGRQFVDNPLVKQGMLIACSVGVLSGVLVLVWNAVRSRLKARESVADGT
jgi:membrane-associated protein